MKFSILQDTQTHQEKLKAITDEIKIIFFEPEKSCHQCPHIKLLLTELEEASDKVILELVNEIQQPDLIKKFGIERCPAMAFIGAKDYGIRYYGTPTNFVECFLDLVSDISKGGHPLKSDVLKEIEKLKKPVNIKVLGTQTCPYTPIAGRTAVRFAISSELITVHLIDVISFPEFQTRYNLRSTPEIVINDQTILYGIKSEEDLLKEIIRFE
ncbi:MAG: thioredoxin family protein [Deltaproteobacteria bacterium]|nr:thioredoxin family protein [Deltaproteobacteria bacterium]MCL5793181.1 thioredoxin family protein [Deltaproteobacteria bacterium]